MTLSLYLAKVVYSLHLLAIIFLVFGSLGPLDILMWHVTAIIVTVIQWLLNKGQCFLTQLQKYLQGETVNKGEEQGIFVKWLLSQIGLSFSDKGLLFLIYGVLSVSLVTSLGRLTTIY